MCYATYALTGRSVRITILISATITPSTITNDKRCGWPLRTGDMYGGAHYVESAAAHLTPQGRAIFEASSKFGDGKTLPVSRSEASVASGYHARVHDVVVKGNSCRSAGREYTLLNSPLHLPLFCIFFKYPPCKRYYNPYAEDGTRMYACRLHSELRMKRLKKEGWKWRGGEKHLDDFWNGRRS